jgi:hypothetical protein
MQAGFVANRPSVLVISADVPKHYDVSCWQIVLQKSFCGMGLKFSEAWARRLINDVGDHVATGQTHRRFWQRVCGSIERRLSLVSFFGENLAAAAFGTFATLSAPFGHGAMSDLSPLSGAKRKTSALSEYFAFGPNADIQRRVPRKPIVSA